MCNEKETWVRVQGYPNYSVSSQGRIRNNFTEKILKHQKSKRGGYYPFVNLYKKGKRKNLTVHGIVMRSFIGKPPVGYVIHHKDADLTNTSVTNLQYITISENLRLRNKRG